MQVGGVFAWWVAGLIWPCSAVDIEQELHGDCNWRLGLKHFSAYMPVLLGAERFGQGSGQEHLCVWAS